MRLKMSRKWLKNGYREQPYYKRMKKFGNGLKELKMVTNDKDGSK